MQVFLNGEPHDVPDGTTVAELVALLQLVPQRVAVELNTQLVRRGDYAQTPLRAGDRVEIVTLVGGG